MRWRIKTAASAEPVEVTLLRIEAQTYFFSVDGEEVLIDSPKVFPFSLQAKDLKFSCEAWTNKRWRVVEGASTFSLEPIAWGSSEKASRPEIHSEMPGRILKVLVKAGDKIEANQSLMVIEAMKMENEIRAVGPGVIKNVAVTPGQSVESGAILIELET